MAQQKAIADFRMWGKNVWLLDRKTDVIELPNKSWEAAGLNLVDNRERP